jgi:transporter family-2 protein
MAALSPKELGLSFLTVLIGAGTTAQVNTNWAVGLHFHIKLFAAFLNLSSGLLLLTLLCALECFLTPGLPLLAWRQRPLLLHLLPGVAGLCYVLSSVFLLQHLGSSLFMVLIVAGQLLCAAALDHYGVGRAGNPKPLTPLRALALAAGMGGACLSVSATIARPSPGAEGTPPWLLALSALGTFFVGGVMVVQALLSRLASELLPSRLAATWWSFAVSATLSGLLFGLQCLFTSPQDLAAFAAADTWASSSAFMYTAAFFGVGYIAGSIFIPPHTSSQSFFVCLVAGQLSFSLVVDAAGLFLRPHKSITWTEGGGVAVVLVAAVLMALPAGLCGASITLAKEPPPVQAELSLQELSERLVGEREPHSLE